MSITMQEDACYLLIELLNEDYDYFEEEFMTFITFDNLKHDSGGKSKRREKETVNNRPC